MHGPMTTILLVCPTFRDRRELRRLGHDQRNRLLFHDYASDALEEMVAPHRPAHLHVRDPIEEMDVIVKGLPDRVDAVVSTDDFPGSTLAAGLARRLGLRGPSPEAVLIAQHKYLSRQRQTRVVPEAVPGFVLVNGAAPPALALRYPWIVKPVKSFFSVGASRVAGPCDFPDALRRASLPTDFYSPFEALLGRYADAKLGSRRVIVEECVTGTQATFEGCVTGGRMLPIGVVDSVLHPGTLAFERFDYPSRLPDNVQQRMADLARAVIDELEYDDGLFNIEFKYDEASGRLSIIEINPRMASQFADLYEKVDGFNTYDVLLAVALRRVPFIPRGRGPYAVAASFVLRTFEDCDVVDVPSPEAVVAIERAYPGARVDVLCTRGVRLSHQTQDEESYRYGAISLGAENPERLRQAYFDCCRRLAFGLVPIRSAAPGSQRRRRTG